MAEALSLMKNGAPDFVIFHNGIVTDERRGVR
jgi:hypothetical protein